MLDGMTFGFRVVCQGSRSEEVKAAGLEASWITHHVLVPKETENRYGCAMKQGLRLSAASVFMENRTDGVIECLQYKPGCFSPREARLCTQEVKIHRAERMG